MDDKHHVYLLAHAVCNACVAGAVSAINSSAYVTDSLRNAAMSVACALFWPDDDAIRDEMMVSYSIDLGKRLKAFGTGTYLVSTARR